jgi:D-tyrosyl-tRNA(Tyr) deacylase
MEIMRAVVQRVSQASVSVDGEVVGRIGSGLAALVGVGHGDDEADVAVLAAKLAGLRIFPDADGLMNLALGDVGGAVLVVSQFTLLADVRRGRRPAFTAAADPSRADRLIEALVAQLRSTGLEVATGRFGAKMEVTFVNDGPVTFVIDVVNRKVRSPGGE